MSPVSGGRAGAARSAELQVIEKKSAMSASRPGALRADRLV